MKDASARLGTIRSARLILAAAGAIFIDPFCVHAAGGDPQGSEFAVDEGAGVNDADSQPAVARDALGDFVVAWRRSTSTGYPATSGILARRFAADGQPLGPAFAVATASVGTQRSTPAVAMAGDGQFVVAWAEGGSTRSEVLAQRYSATGAVQGPALLVASSAPGLLKAGGLFIDGGTGAQPAVAMAADGDFVIAYTTSTLTYVGQFYPAVGGLLTSATRARRYDRNGAAVGREFTVDGPVLATVAGSALNVSPVVQSGAMLGRPAVAIDADGDFVIAWNRDRIHEGSLYLGNGRTALGSTGSLISARRYGPDGKARKPDSRFDFAGSATGAVDVGTDGVGNYVVTWNSKPFEPLSQTPPTLIYAQRFSSSDGAALGPLLGLVDSSGRGFSAPRVAVQTGGDFMITWSAGSFGSEIRAQRYASDSSPQGGNFVINTESADGALGGNLAPAVAVDSVGDFVVSWTRYPPFPGPYSQRIQARRIAGN